MHLISILLLKFFRSYVELDLTLEKKGLFNFFFSILLNDFVFFRLTSSNIYIYTHIHVCVHVCTCKLEINFVPPKIKSCSNIEHLHLEYWILQASRISSPFNFDIKWPIILLLKAISSIILHFTFWSMITTFGSKKLSRNFQCCHIW